MDGVISFICSDESNIIVDLGAGGGGPVTLATETGFSGATAGQAVRIGVPGTWPTAVAFRSTDGQVSDEVGVRVCAIPDVVEPEVVYRDVACGDNMKVVGVQVAEDANKEYISTFDVLCGGTD